ncbi:uncharacterized protein [Eucyclogobius newberryi]|uniref:uncharacterized protein n=1 Tax=Eucyclogobius newberryi TaxID=166745 RepID=UPI003B5AF9F4
MSVSQPAGCVPTRPKSGSSMRLALHNSGDHNGNAFPISSSSSSSASSCLGESSPESLRSLSALNSPGRINSPLDYDMLEVTVLTAAMGEGAGDVVVTKWPTDEEESDRADLVYVERVQTVTDQSESNDNSVSVYLDANSSQCAPETWNENITLALSTNSVASGKSSDDDDSSSRKRSSTPDSTTEIPEDEDDEDEAMFLSIGSDMELQRTSLTAIVAARWAAKEANNKEKCAIEVCALQNGSEEMIPQTQSEKQSSENGPTSGKDVGKQMTDDNNVMAKVTTSPSTCDNEEKAIEIPKNNLQKAGKPRANAIARPIPSNQGKTQSAESNRVGKVDLKNVKSKVGSWTTSSSPTKTANLIKSSPVHIRRPAAMINPVANANARLQRPPLSPMKVAILRPLKGKSRPGPNPNLPQRPWSTSVSSLGSEEANVGTPCDSVENRSRSAADATAKDKGNTGDIGVLLSLNTEINKALQAVFDIATGLQNDVFVLQTSCHGLREWIRLERTSGSREEGHHKEMDAINNSHS